MFQAFSRKGVFLQYGVAGSGELKGRKKTHVDRGGAYGKGVGFDWTTVELRGS